MKISPAMIFCLMTLQPLAAQTGTPPPVNLHGLEEVFITTSDSGETARGRILELGPATLTLLVGTEQREVPLDHILKIEAPRDSVRNGAIIGAAVMGGWCAIICRQGLDGPGATTQVVLANTVFGALLGAGVDALHAGRTTVYRKPPMANRTAGATGARLMLSSGFRF